MKQDNNPWYVHDLLWRDVTGSDKWVVEDEDCDYGVYLYNSSVLDKSKHSHTWLPYQGLIETYEYCECGEKKLPQNPTDEVNN